MLAGSTTQSIPFSSKIEGDENTIMGLPIKQIKQYLIKLKWKNI